MNQTINVTGMTCQNCVRHVSQALSALPGVRSVDVDLQSGSARLESDREIPAGELRAALDEAGYELG
ncbi:MAG TPA: heavy metal-associated domain-containing protein [Candidatus Baltobacteraceae bacterium]|nr:heavy metal-associated domain-containing protein [Candidatus Baltobacteraceae bacterium]